MMTENGCTKALHTLVMTAIFVICIIPLAFADVYINVMAVNGTDTVKETSVKYSLPGDLTGPDILDTNGLELDYDVNNANYYVHGKVTLQPKESKTFRIRVRDVWKLSPQQVDDIKKEIDQGFEQIGKLKDPQAAKLLKDNLDERLDFVQNQSAKAESVEKRIDSFRAYSKELKRIENNALAVDYWRSDPNEVKKDKIIRFNIEVENPLDKVNPYKHKHYLPPEIKPENLVEFEGFEARYDQAKKQVFLYKEEDLQPKEKKKYTIGLIDVWYIPQKDIDYLHKRTDYAFGILKDTKYASSAKILNDQINEMLKSVEDSQAQKRENILDHISAFRDNQKSYETARTDVENLEKLLSLYREDLEKSKVENVLQKVKALKSVSDISKSIFNKAPNETKTWNYISWVLLFVGLLTGVSFVVWFIRSKDKKSQTKGSKEESQSSGEKTP
jgi:hypothetical protein